MKIYIAAGIVTAIYLILFVLSRKEGIVQENAGILGPFCKMALFLYKHICILGFPVFKNKQVERDLERLHPGENREQLVTSYYVKKTALSLLIVLAGTFLGVILCFNAKKGQVLDGQGRVRRGSYVDEPAEITLQTSLSKKYFHIAVKQRKLTVEEAQVLYVSFLEELKKIIIGNNPSLEEVRQDMCLIETLEGFPFQVEWESDNTDLVSGEGRVGNVTGEEKCRLTAVITYEDMEWREEIDIRVLPLILSREEQLYQKLEEILLLSEAEDREEGEWNLPDEYEGAPLVWKQIIEDNSLMFWAIGLAVSVMVFFLTDKDLHDDLEIRKSRMKCEYPDIVQKLVLYMGAGMTIRGAFCKVAGDYEQKKTKGGKEKPAYEEMMHTCRELQTGISEGAAYEHFGKRTGLQEYIRLCTLLQQNLKKGNSTLLERLREEAEKSVSEKMQSGKRRGEEAVTKLLVPMVMMLLVVMVMIMIPAFSSNAI